MSSECNTDLDLMTQIQLKAVSAICVLSCAKLSRRPRSSPSYIFERKNGQMHLMQDKKKGFGFASAPGQELGLVFARKKSNRQQEKCILRNLISISMETLIDTYLKINFNCQRDSTNLL